MGDVTTAHTPTITITIIITITITITIATHAHGIDHMFHAHEVH